MRTDKVGYHYTSQECWERIRKEGLVPYWITKPEFKPAIGSNWTLGVWVWQDRMKGVPHVGSIIWQVSQKATTRVVQLRVRYNDENVLRGEINGNEGRVSISHTGNIGNFYHHTGVEKAYVVTKRIPPEDIKLIGLYDLAKAFRR